MLAALSVLCNTTDVPRSKKRRRDDRQLPGQRRLLLAVPANHTVRARRCGRETCSTCTEGNGHGPYLYAVWREGTRVRRKYLGRE
jgi:hypothetical protein